MISTERIYDLMNEIAEDIRKRNPLSEDEREVLLNLASVIENMNRDALR